MQITWFGHSCFRIDTGKSSILIDPFLTGNPTFEDSGLTVREVAKGVTHMALTHGHEDHTGDTVAICKETTLPLIAVYELAVHMASLGVEKIDPGNTGGTQSHRTSTLPSCLPGIPPACSMRGARSISAPVAGS
jgi:L-ascorbate metabolism protein UlaG (beta-lactamase superfamily)